MKQFLLITVAFVGGVCATSAQEGLNTSTIPPPATHWEGFYIGAQAGGVWGDSVYNEPAYPKAYNFYYDPQGYLGGVFVGYNWQLTNNVVLGAEADIYGGNITGGSLYHINGVPNPLIEGSANLQWAGSVRARAGYAFDRFLPYVTGGFVLGSYSYSVSEVGGQGFSTSPTMAGWTIGAGVEYAVTDNLSARFEYRYSDFGENTVDELQTYGWYTNVTGLKTSDVRLGLALRF